MPRIPYVESENLPSDYEVIEEKSEKLLESVTVEYWNSAATVRAFANNPELSELHVLANVTLWTETGLSLREVELVILTVARGLKSRFVWHAHSIKAIKQADISPEAVLAISARNPEYFDYKERILVRYVQEFVRETGAVADTYHEELESVFDTGTIVGITMLAGFYVHLHHVATALGIDHDEDFVGWSLDYLPSKHERFR